MKFRVGLARCEGGKSVTILTTSARGKFPIVGIVHHDTADEPASWTEAGKFRLGKPSAFDLLGSGKERDNCEEEPCDTSKKKA
jgi:hypothetical protein